MFGSISDWIQDQNDARNASASDEIRINGEILITDSERSETASYDARACATCQGSGSSKNNSNIPIGKQVR